MPYFIILCYLGAQFNVLPMLPVCTPLQSPFTKGEARFASLVQRLFGKARRQKTAQVSQTPLFLKRGWGRLRDLEPSPSTPLQRGSKYNTEN